MDTSLRTVAARDGELGMTVVETLETPEDMAAGEGAELGGLKYAITREQWERRPSE
ncbi:MAG: hypothetical protein J7503_17255 [Cellulomonas iranensis]|uniref:hypothetical protein n=1 Tax=Cellulomonas iranensis TaxID=76862 RepID=UPI001B016CB7|nr:hypothetical protein [Cellulomonas iranensis]MBO9570552.1 hypothetical protein [Cellulomonas iranensis]